jgi:hypothetical protein
LWIRGFALAVRGLWGGESINYLDFSARPKIEGHTPQYPIVKMDEPFRMAVIGSGPAGFYTSYKVMSKIDNAVVDMYEHLPVPFGLVRFGVAPDHPEVKVDAPSSPELGYVANITF